MYNEETKEFEAEINAQVDPIESEKTGKEIYLLPANSTFEKPLDKKDGFKIKWIGSSWIYEKMPEPESPKELTIEELKSIKRSEINQARDEAEQGGFEYMGKLLTATQFHVKEFLAPLKPCKLYLYPQKFQP